MSTLIDQQWVFDKLPLNAEQKQILLKALIDERERLKLEPLEAKQMVIEHHSEHCGSPVQSD